MRILMLGWEFPPFITGGLGTACYGLTKGLDRLGHEVAFVLPRAIDRTVTSHVTLLSPDAEPSNASTPAWQAMVGEWRKRTAPASTPEGAASAAVAVQPSAASAEQGPTAADLARRFGFTLPEFARAVFFALPAGFSSPYGGGAAVSTPASTQAARAFVEAISTEQPVARELLDAARREVQALRAAGVEVPEWAEWTQWLETFGGGGGPPRPPSSRPGDYSGDLFAEAGAYARLVVRLARRQRFDVVHAHDWLTFPAGIAVAQSTGRPLVVHVHATEFDRSGEHVNQRVYDIERRGMHAATRVVCVSEYTRQICVGRYGADPRRTRVVYNGIDVDAVQPEEGAQIEARDKIVLFLGRITMQKGPEYFIAAAKKVLSKIDNVKFVVAGSGDMATRMIELAAQMGIGHKVLFTGFLRGPDVKRVFEMADLYVMPSVSEPFGIAPLEAIAAGTPVIISKQSGVSEVLTHALKVDFWDTDEMANKIVAVLRHPPLSSTLREHGAMEIRKLTWDDAAAKCVDVYGEAIAEMRGV